MNRFLVYEEYGAKYELMIKDLAVVHRTMPQWDKYQKGLEALASSIGPSNSYDDQSKRALTVGDLLVKVSRSTFDARSLRQKQQLTLPSRSNACASTPCSSQNC